MKEKIAPCLVGLICFLAAVIGLDIHRRWTASEGVIRRSEVNEVPRIPVWFGDQNQKCRLVTDSDDRETILKALDFDINATRLVGCSPCGSFTTRFIPNMMRARNAGATKEEIMKRVDRVARLAEVGLYFSREVEIMYKGWEVDPVRKLARDHLGK